MFELTSNKTLMRILSSVTITPGLRSILVFDAPYEGLQEISDILSQLLTATNDPGGAKPIRQYTMGTFETDDSVWGSLYLPDTEEEGGGKKIRAEGIYLHRVFSPERNAAETQVILLPDLTALSTVAARSYTQLIGADVVHLERNGESGRWHPEQCWIAGCTKDAIGKVTSHLLDRFVLRLEWEKIIPTSKREYKAIALELQTRVSQQPAPMKVAIVSDYLQDLAQVAEREVDVSEGYLADIAYYVEDGHNYPRRAIALARLATSLAQLAGAHQLTTGHIEEAAHVLGMSGKRTGRYHIREQERVPESSDEESEEVVPTQKDNRELGSLAAQETVRLQEVQQSQSTYSLLLENVALCEEAYPEDNALVERELDALRIPQTHSMSLRSMRGPIVGIEESNTLHDLAITSTLLAAARWRKVRSKWRKKTREKGIQIGRMDLRRYRRGYVTEQMLMIIFDYTCTRELVGWEEALLPYLSEAYTKRAGIAIIKIGAEDAASHLRAEIETARSILVPRIGVTLERKRGRATPLAHGLSLAQEYLQRVLQHGRSTVCKVTLVVLSDGRGNVPLVASIHDRIDGIVTREGVDDALREARKIQSLKNVIAFVLAPELGRYPDLPERLAEALGATIVPLIQGKE